MGMLSSGAASSVPRHVRYRPLMPCHTRRELSATAQFIARLSQNAVNE